ncbi:RNA-binding domain-containing protein [Flavobacterium sp.]|jgi:ATP-dependent DNA helicase RecG|uniref:RNA-binding domain-containing protein n=1 Tax=Flavobacterium sp. TaxID=239 RepID=UPI00286F28E6|nr:RNA-binding domain-containing protein [Flavobacterium sp.]
MNEEQLIKLLDHFVALTSENECVEFKEAKTTYDFTKLGKYFSALSNEANLKNKDYAWLIFGIEDKKKEIVGSEFRISESYLQSLKKEIADKTTNRISFREIYTVSYHGKRIVLFQIPSALKGIPVAFEGHFYGRDHESLVALNIDKIELIRSQVVQDDWSAQIITDASIDDLDPNAVLKARTEYFNKYPSQASEGENWSNETFLNKARITIQSKVTNSAMLLLGKEENAHFLLPAEAKISWIYKEDNVEMDYEHFSIPFILNSERILGKIRNLTYRYLPESTLFPTEIKTYDPYVIREALHNCIAHQDYLLKGRISVVEKHNEELVFSNEGGFLPGSVSKVIEQDAPQSVYRNRFLANAMVNLNMIDTIGSGIKKMFLTQKKRFFPLPEFDLSIPNQVVVKIAGRIWDINYTKMLMDRSNLDLKTVILLDNVQKGKPLDDTELQYLKKLKLIEGRKPNIYIAKELAAKAGAKASYIKNKGLNDKYYEDMVLKLIEQYKSCTRAEIDDLLLDKLPESLSVESKNNKIKNLIQQLKRNSKIKLLPGKKWGLV